jgi:hypothetical protein
LATSTRWKNSMRSSPYSSMLHSTANTTHSQQQSHSFSAV